MVDNQCLFEDSKMIKENEIMHGRLNDYNTKKLCLKAYSNFEYLFLPLVFLLWEACLCFSMH